jgi:hypothetical protein
MTFAIAEFASLLVFVFPTAIIKEGCLEQLSSETNTYSSHWIVIANQCLFVPYPEDVSQ